MRRTRRSLDRWMLFCVPFALPLLLGASCDNGSSTSTGDIIAIIVAVATAVISIIGAFD